MVPEKLPLDNSHRDNWSRTISPKNSHPAQIHFGQIPLRTFPNCLVGELCLRSYYLEEELSWGNFQCLGIVWMGSVGGELTCQGEIVRSRPRCSLGGGVGGGSHDFKFFQGIPFLNIRFLMATYGS